MKKIIIIAVLTLFISLFFSSCTTKKQHCDAYGQISSTSIEQNNSDIESTDISASKEIL